MNTRHPLIIDADPSDIRVLHSGLELHNRSQMQRAVDHNRKNAARRKADVQKHMSDVAGVGAEVIHKLNTSTRTIKVSEVVKHYQLTEA